MKLQQTNAPTLGQQASRLQSAAFVYEVSPDGRKRVLLVTTRRSRQWSIPKGKACPHLSLAENAAKEAFEEAGVRGEIGNVSVGFFRAAKHVGFAETVIEVWVYPMRATECAEEYPEKGQREVKWVSCREAERLLREPLLVDLCAKLRRGDLE
jgi:8-oxo-dGTP pyrophosphatase MutT (NUDIX family)